MPGKKRLTSDGRENPEVTHKHPKGGPPDVLQSLINQFVTTKTKYNQHMEQEATDIETEQTKNTDLLKSNMNDWKEALQKSVEDPETAVTVVGELAGRFGQTNEKLKKQRAEFTVKLDNVLICTAQGKKKIGKIETELLKTVTDAVKALQEITGEEQPVDLT